MPQMVNAYLDTADMNTPNTDTGTDHEPTYGHFDRMLRTTQQATPAQSTCLLSRQAFAYSPFAWNMKHPQELASHVGNPVVALCELPFCHTGII